MAGNETYHEIIALTSGNWRKRPRRLKSASPPRQANRFAVLPKQSAWTSRLPYRLLLSRWRGSSCWCSPLGTIAAGRGGGPESSAEATDPPDASRASSGRQAARRRRSRPSVSCTTRTSTVAPTAFASMDVAARASTSARSASCCWSRHATASLLGLDPEGRVATDKPNPPRIFQLRRGGRHNWRSCRGIKQSRRVLHRHQRGSTTSRQGLLQRTLNRSWPRFADDRGRDESHQHGRWR